MRLVVYVALIFFFLFTFSLFVTDTSYQPNSSSLDIAELVGQMLLTLQPYKTFLALTFEIINLLCGNCKPSFLLGLPFAWKEWQVSYHFQRQNNQKKSL